MTLGAAGRILAPIHNPVIALIKRVGYTSAAQARRSFEGRLRDAFVLLITVPCPS